MLPCLRRLCRPTRRAARSIVVPIAAGDNWTSKVHGSPPGSTFRILPGLHRLQSVEPRDHDRFVGDPGAVVSGARVLTTWTSSHGRWYASGQTQQGQVGGACRVSDPMCVYPEELFRDNLRQRHVSHVDEVGAGSWWFDYATDRIWVGENPAGHTIETSVPAWAISNHAQRVFNVRIEGLIFEKYATPSDQGVISAPNSHGWVVEDCEVRQGHATGIAIGTYGTVRRCRVYDCAQNGIGGWDSDHVTIEDCEIRRCGSAFDPYWSAAGMKVAQMRNLVIRRNVLQANYGPAIWCDINCRDVLVEDNLCEDNEQSGVFYEISYNAVIRHNRLRRNGTTITEGPAAAGLFIAASANVNVHDNEVEENGAGILLYENGRGWSAMYNEPYRLENVHVHGNDVTMLTGTTGLQSTLGDPGVFTSRGNRFDRNRYVLENPMLYFDWASGRCNDAEWQAQGQDRHGSFVKETP